MQLTMPGFERAPAPKRLHESVVVPMANSAPKGGRATQAGVIHAVLKKRGDMTAHEIAAFCSLDAHEIGKRMVDLTALGMVAPAVFAGTSEPVRRKSPSGRMSQVWAAL